MKKLVITAEKGGVGKTTVSVQLAFYVALRLKKRVLVLDFDAQNNASKTISAQGVATIAPFNTFDIFTRDVEALTPSPFVLVPEGERGTTTLESRASEHNDFATRLLDFLDAVDEQFDVCIIDTGPRADFPHYVALIVADYFVAPLMLTQYALDGIADVLYSEPYGYENIKANLNPKLTLIGILPVMVEAKRVQKSVLDFVSTSEKTEPFLLRLPNKSVARIPRLQAIEEAVNLSMFVGDLKTSMGREAMSQIKPVFDAILRAMDVKVPA
jgi:chromosome partitioning protein